MSDRSAGAAPSRITALLGPTNTGKTHQAVERMLTHVSGMIGLPLRLLAREVYDRIVRLRGARQVALITGEEKIVPPNAAYFVCTVEAMPLRRTVDFLAVDEIQLCADRERGHVFTHRLLHARGRVETLFMGSATMAPLLRRLLPDAQIEGRERFSRLAYAGSKKLTRLPRRSAIVAFSAEQVYAIAELIRRQRGGAAVVMGALSPRTRNAQVALYQSGEVDFLVATDAIGMGLNMDVDHVAFAGLRKFDGLATRWLTPQEIGQIAGRAGRYRTDGTFGVTGEAEELDEDLVAAVEAHDYQPVVAAQWRSARLDFTSLGALQRSLVEAPRRPGLVLSAPALDELTLTKLAADPEVAERARRRDHLLRLWDVCQTPEFRKTTLDEHIRLVRRLFEDLTTGRRRVPSAWMAEQFKGLDRTDGDIDALSARLAAVRTLTYAAHRPDWLDHAEHWRQQTRALEDRLSDLLHERLTARFVDRRTGALLRSLNAHEVVLAGVDSAGQVTVEGHSVGRLDGAVFTPDTAGGALDANSLEGRALRQAAERAVGPEITRRLGQLAADADDAFELLPDGRVLWRGRPAARVTGGEPFAPRLALLGAASAALGSGPARARAVQRMAQALAADARRVLAPLADLQAALDGRGAEALPGMARAVAFRLLEAGGLLDRRAVEAEVRALSQVERRRLRALGVRFAAFTVGLPGLLAEPAQALRAVYAGGRWPEADAAGAELLPLPRPAPAAETLARAGRLALCGRAVTAAALDRLDEALRALPREHGGVRLEPELWERLGWTRADGEAVLRGLGFTPARREDGQPAAWRRRRDPADRRAAAPDAANPFSALAALRQAPAPAPAPPRKRRPPAPSMPAAPSLEAAAPAAAPEESTAAPTPRRRRRRQRPSPTPPAAAAPPSAAPPAASSPAPDSSDAAEPVAPARRRRRARRPGRRPAAEGAA